MFAELDKRENSAKSSKSNPPADITGPIVFYQNGLREEDSFKDEAEDNSGWTEVKSRSSKGEIIHLPSQFVKTMVSLGLLGSPKCLQMYIMASQCPKFPGGVCPGTLLE